MKKIYFIVLVSVISLSLFANIQENKLFQEGVKAYQNNEFKKALDKFIKIDNSGFQNNDLYFNIANTYFRLDNIGFSILYYKKALKLDPNNKSYQKNLNFALTLIEDDLPEKNDSALVKMIKSIYNSISINFTAIALLVIFILIIITINLMIIKRKNSKTMQIFYLTVFIALFIAVGTLGFSKWKRLQTYKEGVITASVAAAYSGPGQHFTRVFTIHEGMYFEIVQTKEGWSQIKLENGLGGWIPTKSLNEV